MPRQQQRERWDLYVWYIHPETGRKDLPVIETLGGVIVEDNHGSSE
jgi:hypothetical protein